MLQVTAALLPLMPLAISNQILQYGIWVYLLVFTVVLLAATIAGGPIPNNTFLLITGAVATENGLSLGLLVLVATIGGSIGYEINYWSGKLFGLTMCRGVCPRVLHDKNVHRALEMMDRFGPVAFILSRLMPVMNVPSFIVGVNGMEHRRFVLFNIFSAAVWSGTVLLSGYYLGGISVVSAYLVYIVDVFFIVLAAAIAIALFLFVRGFMHRNGRHSPE